jgi:hypothetical protein
VAIHPLVRAQVFAVGALGSLGAKGLFRRSCLYGDCCREFWDDLRGELPPSVGYVSVYSRTDGVVDWRACLDEGARHVEVRASHCGMAVNVQTYRAMAEALEQFRTAARRPARRGKRGAAAAAAQLKRAA